MASTTVRITEQTREILRELAEETGESMQDVLARAVESYQRQRFWQRVNAAYSKLRSDPEAWQQELEERAAWDVTLKDGLDDFPYEDSESTAERERQ